MFTFSQTIILIFLFIAAIAAAFLFGYKIGQNKDYVEIDNTDIPDWIVEPTEKKKPSDEDYNPMWQ